MYQLVNNNIIWDNCKIKNKRRGTKDTTNLKDN